MLAHDPASLVALDWTPVVVAIITLIGVIVGPLVTLWVYSRVNTPSGGTPGEAIEKALQTSQANNLYLTLLLREHGIEVPEGEQAA